MTTEMSHLSAVYVVIAFCLLGQAKSQSPTCLSNKDCPNDRLCDLCQCINPCLLNLCDNPVDCKVTNHIPVCSCKGGPSGGSVVKQGVKKFRLYRNVKLNWFEALVNCSSQGMALATIDTQEEHERLIEQIKQEYPGLDTDGKAMWWHLGGSDLLKEGVFLWTSTAKRFKFVNFAEGQPDNIVIADGNKENYPEADCLGLYDRQATNTSINYEWYDGLCSSRMDYICEYFE